MHKETALREKDVIMMLAAVSGYYNGSHIVMDEDLPLQEGQQVIITVLDRITPRGETKKVNLKKYMGRGPKMFETDAGEYVKEMRADDRI